MAVYKVPQDVEADDKLIGPFSFRQFIYLIVVAIAIGLGWGLSQIFIPLAIIPLPVVIFFGVMALPLRKDQPMEVYMAAVVSFYLKPRKRLWQPDGIDSLVEITAPKTVEAHRTKDLSQAEAEQRLSYLADIVDTQGWAVRGIAEADTHGSPMQSDAYYAAQQTEDILDDGGGVARSFDSMISQADSERRKDLLARMQQLPDNISVTPTPPSDPYAKLSQPSSAEEPDPPLDYNPYPTSIRQSVIAPLGEANNTPPAAPEPAPTPGPATTAPTTPTPPPEAPAAPAAPAQPPPEAPAPAQPPQPPEVTTSEKPVSPDIINLANNSDLSIETISHEAQRIQNHNKEQGDSDEVVISLR